MSADEETAARDLMWEAQKSAEEALSLAMLRLGGEAPAQVYDEKGYTIWVESVAKSIWEPVASHLSQELKAAREERDAQREAAEINKVGFDASERLRIAAEDKSNRWQMQYEEECEVHGDHIGALEKCQARIGDLERERHPLDVRRIAELQAELDRVDRERAAAESKSDELERELEDIETLPGLKRALIAERRAVAAEALLAQRDEALERDRILWNEGREEIDEIVVHGCTVHVEQMSDRHWWMAVYKGEGARRFVLDFSVLPGRRKAMTCTGYDDCVEGGPWVWGEDSEHEWPVKS